MPLRYQIKTKSGEIGLWQITETIDELEQQLGRTYSGDARHPIHILQYLASRMALKTLVKYDDIEKDRWGKPQFVDHDGALSISHSGKWAAVMVSESKEVGVDIEELSPRITRIRKKFVRDDEEVSKDRELQDLFLIWGAKEAVYKQYGRKSLNFKNHMQFIRQSEAARIRLVKPPEERDIPIGFRYFDEHNLMLIYTND
jgi:phosphopantetheinyl transferase